MSHQRIFDTIFLVGVGAMAIMIAGFLSDLSLLGYAAGTISIGAIAYGFGVVAEHLRRQRNA